VQLILKVKEDPPVICIIGILILILILLLVTEFYCLHLIKLLIVKIKYRLCGCQFFVVQFCITFSLLVFACCILNYDVYVLLFFWILFYVMWNRSICSLVCVIFVFYLCFVIVVDYSIYHFPYLCGFTFSCHSQMAGRQHFCII
jgi:hypothetical protein